LSYVGRWGRARRWLPHDAQLVADVGCAFGYGTAALAGTGRFRRRVIGVEPDPVQVREAQRRYPWLEVLQGDAAALPLGDATVDAVTMLDVLEHIPDAGEVLAETHRVLRPGGVLILSVPHRGFLAPLDSLNVYAALRRRFPTWQPLEQDEAGSVSVEGEYVNETHRHFAISELDALFDGRFAIDRTARTGLGVTELLNLALLVMFKGIVHWGFGYRVFLPLKFVVYILDDLIPAGSWGYHLTVRAVALRTSERG
jgi:SAM-dependent methyltransferase